MYYSVHIIAFSVASEANIPAYIEPVSLPLFACSGLILYLVAGGSLPILGELLNIKAVSVCRAYIMCAILSKHFLGMMP